jgi:hypothetical protein
MAQPRRYSPLSPGGLAFAFAVLALLAALAMGMPAMLGMRSMMWGAHDAGSYGYMGAGAFGLLGLVWMVAIGALGGAITAWIYNAMSAIGRPRRATCPLSQTLHGRCNREEQFPYQHGSHSHPRDGIGKGVSR